MNTEQPRRSLSRTLVLMLLLFLLAGTLSLVPLLRDLGLRLADAYFRFAPAPERSRVLVVLIDDESLRQIGRWPWSRTVLAQLTRNIAEAGASVIGLDILLSEPQSAEADAVLTAALGKRTVLVDKIGSYPEGPRWTEPMPGFASSAGAVGHALAPLDRDGVCRRYPPLEVTTDGPRWAFAVEVARMVDPAATARFLSAYGVAATDETGPVSIARPVLVPIAFRIGGFETISAAQVLRHSGLERLRGRPVLVGFGPTEIADRVMTPVSGELPTPGVEVHAHIVDAILGGQVLKDEPLGGGILLLAVTSLVAVAVFSRWRGWMAAVALPVLGCAVYGVSWELFTRVHRVPPIGAMMLAVVAGPVVVYSADLLLVERSIGQQLRELRRWLASKGAATTAGGSGLAWRLGVLQALQSQLGALYELHDTLLESSQDLIAIFDGDARLLLANGAFAGTFGDDARAGTPLSNVKTRLAEHPDAPLVENGTRTEGEAHVGEKLYFVRIVPLAPTTLSPKGGAVMVLTDLAPRVERDRARAEALGFVTHELRTPLVSIQGFAEVMMRYPESPANATAPETIFRESRRLLALINSYLDVLRLDAGARAIRSEAVPMGTVVRQVFEIVQPLAAAAGMTLTFQDGANVAVQGDEVLLTGAVLNLVSNAIKYGTPGTEVRVSCATSGATVVFSVHNHGEPIAAQDLARLCEPFYRSPEAESAKTGWGLGLAFVKRIAEKHGGSVHVQNTDNGVLFEVHLPVAVQVFAAKGTL